MNAGELALGPTGGTERAAHIMGKTWDGKPAKIDLSDPKTDFTKSKIKKEDMVFIAMPSFGGRAPAAALAFQKACFVRKENKPFL